MSGLVGTEMVSLSTGVAFGTWPIFPPGRWLVNSLWLECLVGGSGGFGCLGGGNGSSRVVGATGGSNCGAVVVGSGGGGLGHVGTAWFAATGIAGYLGVWCCMGLGAPGGRTLSTARTWPSAYWFVAGGLLLWCWNGRSLFACCVICASACAESVPGARCRSVDVVVSGSMLSDGGGVGGGDILASGLW